MSGPQQHTIPQFFLKGFVIPDGNDKLWLYKKSIKSPVAVGIGDAGQGRYFYSKPSTDGPPTL